MFTELGIAVGSSSSCDRLPKLLSAVWESHREHWERALRQQEVVAAEAAVVAVSLDRAMVPDQDAQRFAKAAREAAKKQGLSRQCSGPGRLPGKWAGTVTLVTQTPSNSTRCATRRAPEYKKQTLTAQLDAELASILCRAADLEVVALADGAEENWRYFERPVYDKATKIVDHGHASQHLRAAMAAYYGEQSVAGRAEYERLRIILRDQPGGADDVIAALSRLARKTRGKKNKRRRKLLNAELTYFTNQRERLDYAEYQARGLPIGSGMVEAACQTLATQRLKRSGISLARRQASHPHRSQSPAEQPMGCRLGASLRTSASESLRSVSTVTFENWSWRVGPAQ